MAAYNSLLGGKLVALLLCSPEIVKEYEARYGAQTSLIASSMRGASVKRNTQRVNNPSKLLSKRVGCRGIRWVWGRVSEKNEMLLIATYTRREALSSTL